MKSELVFGAEAGRSSALAAKAVSIAWVFIWIGAVGLASLIHLAFLVAWPDHFVHEDSATYLEQAQSFLNGDFAKDPGKRPYGVAIALVLLSKVFRPDILVFVTAQHVMSIVTAILIAMIVRFSGAPRIFSLLAFLFAAVYARTVHYDNTIGAETPTVFLTAVAAFIASGAVLRNWPPLLSAIGIGLSLGAMVVCRSAGIGPAFVILLWLAVFLNTRLVRRLGIVALAGVVTAAVSLTPAAMDRIVGKRPAGENLPVMSFLVGYSADFNRGVHLERKALARSFVDEKRASDTRYGWADTDKYQWPLEAVALMREPDESRAEFEKIVRDIFIETLTTPSTLWRHLTRHFAREMYFLLFDGNMIAGRVSHPQGYEFFVQREPFPDFNSPTGLKSRRLIYDNYSPPPALSWLLPSADKLQSYLDTLFNLGYAPRYSPTPLLCCGLRVSGEYDYSPGPIRWLSALSLIALMALLASKFAGGSTGFPPLHKNLVAGSALMILLVLANAAFPAFLVYGLHRYGYYVAPFLAGAAAILGTMACDRMKRVVNANRAAR